MRLKPDLVHILDGVAVYTHSIEDVGTSMQDSGRDVLLLDGDCGLCHQLAFFMDPRLESGVDIAYRPIKSDDAQKLIHTFPEWQQRSDTVYLWRNGRAYIRSAAAIRCLLYLRWYWKIWFFYFLAYSTTNTRYDLPVCNQIQALDF